MRGDRTQGVGNLVLAKRDGQPVTKAPVDHETRKQPPAFLGNMDAIACGVEAWFEDNTGYSRKITESTVDIARALSVPEGEIKRWESSRSSRNSEKSGAVKSLLVKLQGDFH